MKVLVKVEEGKDYTLEIRAVQDRTTDAQMRGWNWIAVEGSPDSEDDWTGQVGGLSHFEHHKGGKMYAVYFAETPDETKLRVGIDSGDVMVFIDDED